MPDAETVWVLLSAALPSQQSCKDIGEESRNIDVRKWKDGKQS